jgi:hypothetical protein
MGKTIRHTRLTARGAAALAIAIPALVVMVPTTAHAQFSLGLDIRIGYAPPPMPVYEQPPLPGPDYIWVPGHWAWSDDDDDYFWAPGYWELPPEPGLLWTPAWWGWDNGAFRFHGGYWGHEVGWYGGIDYGYGYHGHGWEGGRWENGHLAYNRAAVNITNVRVTNVYYQQTSVTNHNGPRTSYAGGNGGVHAQPTPQELRATQAPHIAPTPAQQQRVQQAAANPRNVASRVTPGWQPPAVHRVGADGTPLPRAAAPGRGGATTGAPSQYQRPPAGMAPGQNPARPATPYAATPRTYPGQPATPARPAMPNQAAPGGYRPAPAPAYNQAPRPVPAPAYNQAARPVPAPGYAQPPRPAPAPNAYHPAPPAAPRPAPAPKAPPKPAPRPEHEHQ